MSTHATENIFWTQAKEQLSAQQDLREFKNWNIVRQIPLYATNSLTESYFEEVVGLLESFDEQESWIPLLKEPFLGHNEDSLHRAKIQTKQNIDCTSWTLKSAHHILIFESVSGNSIHDYEQIVEFGAGIGETARIIRDLGFRGDYYIYDLPEVSRISTFYLDGWAKNVEHYSEVSNNRRTLFIGTWSLSEVPYDYRNEIAAYFFQQDFLIVFQNLGLGYDNLSYFKNEFWHVSDTFCRFRKLFLGAVDPGSHYLVGLGRNYIRK